MTLLLILITLGYILPSIGLFKLFQKAGKKGWLSLIPFYNLVVISNVIGKPWWLLPILFVPVIGHIIVVFFYLDMINCYKKHTFFEMLIAAIFPFIWLPYLGFSKQYDYHPGQSKYLKLFLNSFIIYILLIAFVSTVRMLLFEVATIPTSSMASTLNPGETVFVNKTSYGPRLPITLLSLPFFIFEPFSIEFYSDKITLPYKRLWQINPIVRNDIIVFNYPAGDTVSTEFESNVSFYTLLKEYGRKKIHGNPDIFGHIEYRPIDKRTRYIFRCVALPGETLKMIEGNVIINGKQLTEPPTIQYKYLVISKVPRINEKIFEKYNINEIQTMKESGYFTMFIPVETKPAFEKLSFIKEVSRYHKGKGAVEPHIFPFNKTYDWNSENMGPIYIPQRDVPIKLTLDNIPIYYRLINTYEGNEIRIVEEQISINGKITDEYIPKMDYYWVMGDNRDNAADSRYWGFVPENHIIGKVNQEFNK